MAVRLIRAQRFTSAPLLSKPVRRDEIYGSKDRVAGIRPFGCVAVVDSLHGVGDAARFSLEQGSGTLLVRFIRSVLCSNRSCSCDETPAEFSRVAFLCSRLELGSGSVQHFLCRDRCPPWPAAGERGRARRELFLGSRHRSSDGVPIPPLPFRRVLEPSVAVGRWPGHGCSRGIRRSYSS